MADQTQEGGQQGSPEMDARPTLAPETPVSRTWRDQDYPTAQDFPAGGCVLGAGSDLEIAPGHPGWEWVARNCRFERGFRSHLRYGGESQTAPVEKSMPAQPVAAPAAPPAHAEAHTVPAAPVAAAPAAPALPSLPDLSPAGLAGALTGAASPQPAAQTVATVAQPDALASQSELAGVLAKGGDANVFTVVLGAIAVLGGGAAWKFYNKRTELKHEERMKELDNSKSQDDETRKQCQAANAMAATKLMELEMRLNAETQKTASEAQKLAALTQRVEATEKKTSSFSADFDSEDLSEWRAKVDKTLKAMSKKPKA